MEQYTVSKIAEMLHTNEETVRRWIRSGQLEAIRTSRKEGNIVSQQMLDKFLEGKAKYRRTYSEYIEAASPGSKDSHAHIMPIFESIFTMASAPIALLILQQIQKSKDSKSSTQDVLDAISREQKECQKRIDLKSQTVHQLIQEIADERKRLVELNNLMRQIKNSSEMKG